VTPLRATAEPSASPAAATPEAVESAAPSPAPATPTPKPATPKPVAAVKPDVSAKPVAVAPPVKTAAPVPVKAAPTTAPVTETADSDFARQSAGVVRAYLTALARGDDTAAEAALDAPTGSREASLTEKEFAGPDMRIARIEAHGTGDSARVDVDLLTAKGAYFAQFFVKKSASGAPLIVDHDFIKP
jgi:outer membrane biosynthesis protein TonB